jgi:hypothetical protein
MSKKIRTTVSLNDGIMDKARELMAEHDFSDFSGFLEQLVRDKWADRAERQSELAETAQARHDALRAEFQTTKDPVRREEISRILRGESAPVTYRKAASRGSAGAKGSAHKSKTFPKG